MRRLPCLALTTLAVLATAGPAAAATPEQGSVGRDNLQQRWSGEAYGQPFNNFAQTKSAICLAPFCDSFALEVKDAGELTLRVTAPDSAGFVAVWVTLPNGTVERYDGASGEVANVITYEDAEPGNYTLRVWGNMLYGLDDGTYTGRATLVLPPEPTA
jgi:hypothetical protein